MERTLVCLLLSLGLTSGVAQTTWSGLRFGMTPDEVKALLKDKQVSEAVEPKNDDRHWPQSLVLTVNDIAVAQHKGQAKLVFPMPERKLWRILLIFDRDSAGRECFDVPPEEQAERIMLVEEVSGKLIERYGRPVSDAGIPTRDEMGNWYTRKPLSSKMLNRVWKSERQIVTQTLWMICGSVYLSVSYSPEEKSEL